MIVYLTNKKKQKNNTTTTYTYFPFNNKHQMSQQQE